MHLATRMPDKLKVLFLCTANSCRSPMAEAILRHLAGDRFEALSAGSHPAGFIHPISVDTMQRMDIPMEDQTSKSWDEYAQTPIDAVITLCDDAAREVCPVSDRDAICVHWSLPDPVGHPGNEEERLELALRVAERLRTKIEGLIDLDWFADRAELVRRLEFLGEI